jgi:hypothetical protein
LANCALVFDKIEIVELLRAIVASEELNLLLQTAMALIAVTST